MAGEDEKLIAVLPQAVVFVRSQLQNRGAALVQAFADVGGWLQLDEEAPREFCDAFIYLTEQGLITGRAFAPSIEVVHEVLLPDRERVHRGRSLRLGRSGFWTREGHKSDRLGRSTVTPFRVVGAAGAEVELEPRLRTEPPSWPFTQVRTQRLRGAALATSRGDAGVLRVLIADESPDRLAVLSAAVRGLGHETVAAEIEIGEVGPATVRERPDVALVALGKSGEHALELISKIVGESECPVIAVLAVADRAFIQEAAKRGIFAYVVESEQGALESALQIVLLRFAEYHGLEGAFGRRAITERAKGILMERHGLNEAEAFELLRNHARRNNQKMVDVATAVTEGALQLPPP